MSNDDRIDRAGTGARYAAEVETAILEEIVENTPDEGAVGAAALKPDVDELGDLLGLGPGPAVRL